MLQAKRESGALQCRPWRHGDPARRSRVSITLCQGCGGLLVSTCSGQEGDPVASSPVWRPENRWGAALGTRNRGLKSEVSDLLVGGKVRTRRTVNDGADTLPTDSGRSTRKTPQIL